MAVGTHPQMPIPMLRLQWELRATWVWSTVEILLCSMASGSIFFLMARLLTVMVSVFTGYKETRKDTLTQDP